MTLRTAIVACMMLWAGLTAGGQDRTPDRIGRLEQWLEAIEQHQLGEPDESLLRVASWDRNTLWLVWMDAGTIVSLVREPEILVFQTPYESEPFSGVFRNTDERTRIRMRTIPYGRDELRRLQRIARDVAQRGGEDRILKRGAALHSDIAMSGARPAVRDPERRSRTDTIMLFLADGQQTGIEDANHHWEMGRRLLDRVRPKNSRTLQGNPGTDETVRRWYLAVNVYMQVTEQMDPWQGERSVQLFPRDPEILFFAACGREWFSGPQAQNTLLSTNLSRELFNMIGTEDEELRRAERLFRESLEREPRRNEARIRLGRVLGRRGRHQDAIAELRQATKETQNRLLLYYGNMFLGAEADALGFGDEARQAYTRAADLYPRAQSPRLALSTLAASRGDRAAALSTIQPVLSRDDVELADDPWWSYYTSQARDIEGIVEALYQIVQAETQ
ncbi:MAG TPA: tetratricopeptide repeat protein [Vicinamibacterales bacterium]|nr:tetratricopeptide repeat protein [Vicinamibacterales bacterium]